MKDFESESLVLGNAYAVYKLPDIGKYSGVSGPQSLYPQMGMKSSIPNGCM